MRWCFGRMWVLRVGVRFALFFNAADGWGWPWLVDGAIEGNFNGWEGGGWWGCG